MGEPPKLPIRGSNATADKTLPRPPTGANSSIVKDNVDDTDIEMLTEDISTQKQQDTPMGLLEQKQGFRPLPTIPKVKVEIRANETTLPTQSDINAEMQDFLEMDIDDIVANPTSAAKLDNTAESIKSIHSKKSIDSLAFHGVGDKLSRKPSSSASIKTRNSAETGSLKRKDSRRSVKSLKSRSPERKLPTAESIQARHSPEIVPRVPSPTNSVKSISLERNPSIKESIKSAAEIASQRSSPSLKSVKLISLERNPSIKESIKSAAEIASLRSSPSLRSLKSANVDSLERKLSKSEKIKAAHNSGILPPKRSPTPKAGETPNSIPLQPESSPVIKNTTSSSPPKSSVLVPPVIQTIPLTGNSPLLVPIPNRLPQLDTATTPSATSPVPIYAGGVFLGYGTGNTPTRPNMMPLNPQLYARPRYHK
jgi:hypothetical protein